MSEKIIEVWVKPGSKKGNQVIPGADGELWTVYVAAKPVEGVANDAVTSLIAAHLGLPKHAVTIKSGTRSRRKLIRLRMAG